MESGRTFVVQARASSAPAESAAPLSGFVALASLSVCCRWNTSERACPPRTSKRRAIGRRAPCGKDRRSGSGRGRGGGRVFLIHRRISFWHGMCGRQRDPFALRGESSVHRTCVAMRNAASRRGPSRNMHATAAERAGRPPCGRARRFPATRYRYATFRACRLAQRERYDATDKALVRDPIRMNSDAPFIAQTKFAYRSDSMRFERWMPFERQSTLEPRRHSSNDAT